jgi:rod shape-determining protein MreC
MQQLFLFIYQYRAFFLLVVLELFCGWLIITNNRYQGAAFFNSSNRLAAGILQTSHNVSEFFALREVNQQIVAENARLQQNLLEKTSQVVHVYDTTQLASLSLSAAETYEFIPAKVINNSVRNYKNHITINKGRNHGIEPGMGVISGQGIVGKVRTVSANYSVITSVLHGDVLVSSKLKRTGDLCTTKWNGTDPLLAQVLYLPSYIKVQVGDSIVSSGFNAVYPEGVMIGRVKEVELRNESLFYDIKLELSTPFNRLGSVYALKYVGREERDSLETKTHLLR